VRLEKGRLKAIWVLKFFLWNFDVYKTENIFIRKTKKVKCSLIEQVVFPIIIQKLLDQTSPNFERASPHA